MEKIRDYEHGLKPSFLTLLETQLDEQFETQAQSLKHILKPRFPIQLERQLD